jgi:hypothetical protein
MDQVAKNALVNMVPDLLLCWAVTALTENGWKGFFITFAGLQGLYFFLWFKTAVWSWILFWVYDKRSMSRALEKLFSDSRFPAPDNYVEDLDDYLTEIMDDETIDPSLRTKAAFELGTLNGFKTTRNVSLCLKISSASKDALDRYARYAPRRFSRDG